jgi:coatomer subunit beta
MLIQPLISICRSCLKCHHPYIRNNAVFAVYSIYRSFEHLIADAPELMQTFFAAKSVATCKRNAFVFWRVAMDKAVEWLFVVYDTMGGSR